MNMCDVPFMSDGLYLALYASSVIKLGILDRTKLPSFIKLMHTNSYTQRGRKRLFLFISLTDYQTENSALFSTLPYCT